VEKVAELGKKKSLKIFSVLKNIDHCKQKMWREGGSLRGGGGESLLHTQRSRAKKGTPKWGAD